MKHFLNIFIFVVNDEPVDDGAKGCERAKQILACAFEHRDEVNIYVTKYY